MNRLGLAAALVVGLALAVPAGAQDQKDWTEIRGTWSAIQQPRELVVQDETTWKALWAEHTKGMGQQTAAPAVDFAKETVVAVFLGVRTEKKPLDLKIEKNKNGEVVVSYQESKKGSFGLPVVCQPFELRKLPKAQQVRIEKAQPGKASGVILGQAEQPRETGVRDAVAQVSGKVRNIFGAQKTDSLLFDGGDAAGAKVQLMQLPPPPGQGQQGQDGQDPRRRQGGNLPPPPGGQQGQQGRQGGNLPPPPQQGGNLPPPPQQGGNLPPPPDYRPRPSDPSRLPPPPGSGIPSSDSGVTSTGYWRVYRDILGYPEERYGNWQQEETTRIIERGGSESGKTQGTRYSASLDSREFRRRYVLYTRLVGYDCDPMDDSRCRRWEREWRWFYEDTRYGQARRMQVVVEFAQDQPIVPWDTETLRIHYDGSRIWIEYADPAFRYVENGPVVNQQTGTASIILTPTARILRAPEREKVTAHLVSEGGRLKLVIQDLRSREYAGEVLDIAFSVYRDDPWSWRNPLGADTKVSERTFNGPERITVDPSNPRRVIDLGISGSAEYYLDSWSFRRVGKRLSTEEWIRRGSGNRIKL